MLRPGRFDRHLYVGLPNRKDRKELYLLISKKTKFADDITSDDFCDLTEGYSGAEIVSIVHDAALASLESFDHEVL